jgi:zinc protease
VQSLNTLRSTPIDADLLQRARQPVLETYDNGLKTNSGWLYLVDRAQTQADLIDRYLNGKAVLAAITPAEIEVEAQKYLDPARAVETLALPQGAQAPYAAK